MGPFAPFAGSLVGGQENRSLIPTCVGTSGTHGAAGRTL